MLKVHVPGTSMYYSDNFLLIHSFLKIKKKYKKKKKKKKKPRQIFFSQNIIFFNALKKSFEAF